jgi:hypothetical protein
MVFEYVVDDGWCHLKNLLVFANIFLQNLIVQLYKLRELFFADNALGCKFPIREVRAKCFLQQFDFFFSKICDFRKSISISCLRTTGFLFVLLIELLDQLLSYCFIYLNVVIGLLEYVRVKFLEILF